MGRSGDSSPGRPDDGGSRASGERVRIGRGTDNEVRLSDIHVGLRAAALVVRDGVLYVDRLDTSPLEVNGAAVETAPLKPGDQILLGPYRIEILPAPLRV